MAGISNKRSRKSKLVPRDCDLVLVCGGDAFCQDESDRAAKFLQEQPTNTLDKIKDKIDNETFEYQNGSKRSSRFSIEIEVEETDTAATADEELIESLSDSEISAEERQALLNPSCEDDHLIILPSKVAAKMNKALQQPSNFIERKIEIEIRNEWVQHLERPEADHHETLLQRALQEWRLWACLAKHIRLYVLAYKCLTCSIGWWHLEPFREHIKRHDDVKLRLEAACHECSIVASCGEWFEHMCRVRIDGKCPRCLKPSEAHTEHICDGCKAKFHTCLLLFQHEAVCHKFLKLMFQNQIIHESYYQCDICEVSCLTSSRYNDHLLLYHQVRSDVLCTPDTPLPKTCSCCNKKYWIYNTHFCPEKGLAFKCRNCHRRYSNKHLLYIHENFTKKSGYCKECQKLLPKQCMELEHYIKHSKKYTLMYKCLACKDYVFFYTEKALLKHFEKLHTSVTHNKHTKKKPFISRKILPIECLALEDPPGINLIDMIKGKDPKENTKIYPLLGDLFNESVLKQITRTHTRVQDQAFGDNIHIVDSGEKRVNILRRSRNQDDSGLVYEETASCSTYQEEGDDEDDKMDVVDHFEVKEDSLNEFVDYDNLDDDRLEEEENEIMMYLERNIVKKQEAGKSPTSDLDDPVILEAPSIEHGEIFVKQEPMDEDQTISNQEIEVEIDDTTMHQENASISEGIATNQETVLMKQCLKAMDEELIAIDKENRLTNEETIVKQERLSIDEHSQHEDLLVNEKVSESFVKKERISIDQEKQTFIDNHNNESLLKKEITLSVDEEAKLADLSAKTDNQVSKNGVSDTVEVKEEIMDYEDDLLYNDFEEIQVKTELGDSDSNIFHSTEDKVFQSAKDFASILNTSNKEVLDCQTVSKDLNLNPETSVNKRPDSKRKDIKVGTHKIVCLPCGFRGTFKELRSHNSKCPKRKKQAVLKQTQQETHIPSHQVQKQSDNNEIQVKTEPDTSDSDIFQSAKDLANILNTSDIKVLDSRTVSEELNVKSEANIEILPDSDDKLENSEGMDIMCSPCGFRGSCEVIKAHIPTCPRAVKRKLYECKHCNFRAEHKDYRLHKEGCRVLKRRVKRQERDTSIHTLYESYPCTKCNKEFSDIRKYLQHFPYHGFDEKQCPVCLQSDVISLSSHVNSHVKQSFLKLQVLEETSKMLTSKVDGLFQCKTCSDKVECANFFAHWESHLKFDEKTDGDDEVMKIDENMYTLKADEVKALLKQLTTQRDMKSCCVLCGRRFSRRNDCKRHCITHLLQNAFALHPKYGTYRCQHCSENFTKPDQLKDHLRQVAAMTVFRCDLCNKTFSDSSNFAKHRKVHNFQTLICDICKKKFASRLGLERHIQLHATTEPESCDKCEQIFYSASALRKHKLLRHDTETPRFKCKVCHMRFRSLKNTWDHLWDVHKERKHKTDCPICGESFRKYIDVRNHLKYKHPGEQVAVRNPARKRQLKTPRNVVEIDEFLKCAKVVELSEDEDDTLIIYDDGSDDDGQ